MTVVIAFKALARNKLRTGLTMLGMIIGVAAVIGMVALGTGAQRAVADQIRGAGTNMVSIFPGSVMTGGARQGGGTARLAPDDAAALRALPAVDYVSEGVQSRQQVISIVGGSIGIAAGFGVAGLLRDYFQSPTLIPPDAIVTAVGFSAGVGIFFGFYPARKAASLVDRRQAHPTRATSAPRAVRRGTRSA